MRRVVRRVDWIPQLVIALFASGILAIISFAVTYAGTLIYVPNITIDLIPYKENIPGVTIDLKNNGLAPATNTKFTVEFPHNITHVDIFSTENYTKENSSRVLEINLPRFAQGGGSIVKINALMDPHSNITKNDRYTVYSTYNQGSKMNTEYIPAAEPSGIPSATLSVPVLITVGVSILGGAIVFIIQLKYQQGRYLVIYGLSVKVKANSTRSQSRVTTFKNGMPTRLSVIVFPGYTGTFENTTDSEVIRSNERLDFVVESEGDGKLDIETVSVQHHF